MVILPNLRNKWEKQAIYWIDSAEFSMNLFSLSPTPIIPPKAHHPKNHTNAHLLSAISLSPDNPASHSPQSPKNDANDSSQSNATTRE